MPSLLVQVRLLLVSIRLQLAHALLPPEIIKLPLAPMLLHVASILLLLALMFRRVATIQLLWERVLVPSA